LDCNSSTPLQPGNAPMSDFFEAKTALNNSIEAGLNVIFTKRFIISLCIKKNPAQNWSRTFSCNY
jgi:hypothetical protein